MLGAALRCHEGLCDAIARYAARRADVMAQRERLLGAVVGAIRRRPLLLLFSLPALAAASRAHRDAAGAAAAGAARAAEARGALAAPWQERAGAAPRGVRPIGGSRPLLVSSSTL